MKATLFSTIFLVSIIIFISAAPLTAQQESKDQLVKFYESCILQKVSNCNAKAVLKTSRSVNLRRKAELSLRQAAFFTSNKDILINEMVEQGIGQKHYQVEYYLNKRFYEINQ